MRTGNPRRTFPLARLRYVRARPAPRHRHDHWRARGVCEIEAARSSSCACHLLAVVVSSAALARTDLFALSPSERHRQRADRLHALNVTGTGYVAGAVVRWNSSARTTTFQLAHDIAEARLFRASRYSPRPAPSRGDRVAAERKRSRRTAASFYREQSRAGHTRSRAVRRNRRRGRLAN